MKSILLAGMQASGKGTQADFLVQQGYQFFSMGDAIRERVAVGDEYGTALGDRIAGGNLIDLVDVDQILRNKISTLDLTRPFIIDGFPRDADQEKIAREVLGDAGCDYTVLMIELSEDEAWKRIDSRLVDSVTKKNYGLPYKEGDLSPDGNPLIRRVDDSDREAIATRISVYLNKTLPVLESFEVDGKLIRVNGLQSPEAVRDEIFEKLGL